MTKQEIDAFLEMEEFGEFTYLWSYRFSVARGWRWDIERKCKMGDAQQWLEVFQKDEPNIEFCISVEKPKNKHKENVCKERGGCFGGDCCLK